MAAGSLTRHETAQHRVYVRPFLPKVGAVRPEHGISCPGGLAFSPRWRADGAQLFFIAPVLDLMAVEVNTRAGVPAGTPQRLFAAPPPLLRVGWSLAPGGARFLFVTTPDGGKPAPYEWS